MTKSKQFDVINAIESILNRDEAVQKEDIAALIEYVRVRELQLAYLEEPQKEKFWSRGITQEKIADRLHRVRKELGIK